MDEIPDGDALGTREGEEFKWTSWSQLNELSQNLATGLLFLGLCPEVQAEGKSWKFIGIQSKNREEWFVTMLAAMSVKITTVAFYDTLGDSASMFMVNQTRISTMAMTSDCIEKICKLKMDDP